MRIVIPLRNCTRELADAIDNASDGDTIVVHSAAMRELGENARKRMCPDKRLTFEVDEVAAYLESGGE